ncbi:MarR family winged helix-turn-helix transcriptional regulator [Streptomyces rapamycinicus]|uniref:DNA-binding MarR family transcriptional regulator n=1 Tax=Streptomyces rapamycinicus TaxID=1226757 RepID=A0ABR6LX77_9ACTN|nr:MarR family transcriptional regulator [Streptomyces rapamycinicus]MBB4786944.1 DNA-binding MarR family transcriptional regulator [Streptomyces rapamycinicus]UTO66960.1 MarR family transcriptional regulator [Streptomyces rapamycinicus]UTP34917.1 MarR family transcriptional regulator [Streptomyces rapamycinicus NRRL 5491]
MATKASAALPTAFICRTTPAGRKTLGRPLLALTSELAEQLGVTKQAAGQIVDDLEKRGYVERRPHPAGGRRRLVVLTGKALEHLSVAGRILHELEAQLARRLHEAGLRVPRAEIAAAIRALAGDSIPPLRPIW